MRFGSVCSGIEAASVAWNPLGWEAAWLSEIEPFPSAVLKHHYPSVPNLGDMSILPDRVLSGEIEAPDILCGGCPCQSFSVSGAKRSLSDSRGNLTLIFCELANSIDTVRKQNELLPAIVFYENVPGILNTKDNAFGCFLAGLAGESMPLVPTGSKWTNSGVVFGPQRAVAWRVLDAQHFGLAQRRKRVFVVASARDDISPAEILFEFEGVRRDTQPSKSERENLTEPTGTSIAISGEQPNPITYSIMGNWIGRKPENGGNATEPMVDIAPCLTKTDRHAVATYGIQSTIIGRKPENGPHGSGISDDLSFTLTKTDKYAVAQLSQVRRLTPVECERLQGFPDSYTRISYKNKPESECPDNLRYQALGNSWAVPVVRWIGQRIDNAVSNATYIPSN